jgi:2-amino-4-hydroxy-6-hydroxymethyldihydropteridine diphosphokinase
VALARIGLGSNVGDPSANVAAALGALERIGRVRARSSLYATPAWGVREQAPFVNAAALLETVLPPRDLLGALKAIEAELGREPTYRWGPRVIDLDILAYGDLRVEEPDLVIPHPRLTERAFALVPLAEIDAAFIAARDALPAHERDAVQRIPAAPARTTPAVNWDETLERVRSAAAFCATAGLTRFRVEEDDLTIEVRRSAGSLHAAAPAPLAEIPASSNGASVSGNGSAAAGEKPKNVLKAEFVGIVRLSRPAVARGSVIGEDRELAYVEALGIRNPVRSRGPGRVAEVFVADGQAVEYGQPLFAIEV